MPSHPRKKNATSWKPGLRVPGSGNNAGCRHRATIAAEVLLDGECEGLTRKAIEKALEGDMVAMRLCLERIIPPRRDRPVRIELPPIDTAAGVSMALSAVTRAMAGGELTPDEANGEASIVELKRRALETTEFEARLRKLEEALPK